MMQFLTIDQPQPGYSARQPMFTRMESNLISTIVSKVIEEHPLTPAPDIVNLIRKAFRSYLNFHVEVTWVDGRDVNNGITFSAVYHVPEYPASISLECLINRNTVIIN